MRINCVFILIKVITTQVDSLVQLVAWCWGCASITVTIYTPIHRLQDFVWVQYHLLLRIITAFKTNTRVYPIPTRHFHLGYSALSKYRWWLKISSRQNKCIGDDTKAEAQAAFGKQKRPLRSMERDYLSHWRFSMKKFPRQNVTEMGESGYIGRWVMAKKTIFNIAAVHHLECKNILGHVTAIYFQMCYYVRNFIEIGWLFTARCCA